MSEQCDRKRLAVRSVMAGPGQTAHNVSMKMILFKGYVMISTILIWSAYSLLLRYSRTRTETAVYFPTAVVFLSECLKFSIALFMLLRSHEFCWKNAKRELQNSFFSKPLELLKMSVPSIAYAIQNNLDFLALSKLDPGVYQVTSQLKIVTTAFFMVVMLQRQYTSRQWIAISLLCAGVALVQFDTVSHLSVDTADPTSPPSSTGYQQTRQDRWTGLTAVLGTCLTAAFAGVYFEQMLKDVESSFWIRNLQMYFCGMISSGLACLAQDGPRIKIDGFCHGFDIVALSIVGLLSLGGIYISLMIKYLDNVLKSFASSMAIVIVSVMSTFIFGSNLGAYFVIGSLVVCSSVIIYNSSTKKS